MFWLNPQIPIKSKIIVIDKPEPFSKIITNKFYLKGGYRQDYYIYEKAFLRNFSVYGTRPTKRWMLFFTTNGRIVIHTEFKTSSSFINKILFVNYVFFIRINFNLILPSKRAQILIVICTHKFFYYFFKSMEIKKNLKYNSNLYLD